MTDTNTPPAASERMTAERLEEIRHKARSCGPMGEDLKLNGDEEVKFLLAQIATLSVRAEAAERELAATLGMLGEVTGWCKGYEAKILCLTKEREAAEARAETARATLNEVVTNGYWSGGPDFAGEWCISKEVYEMAQEAAEFTLTAPPPTAKEPR